MSSISRKFFERDTLKVAKDLLGKFLCISLRRPTSKLRRWTSCHMITEVEAYDGPLDKASHAHGGKTARNAPMFGPAGVWYVYFVYGMHFMLNIVTGPKDYPAAVLIRSCELVNPKSEILNPKQYQNSKNKNPKLNGPGKLTKFLKISKKFNNKLATPKTGLWIEDCGVKIKKSQIKTSPRIGVSYAEEWKEKHYRFFL